jgi:glycosyltransferase involved in cell wall biosynthesis
VKINVTYIISNINKSLAFEWIVSDLDKDKFNLSFILLNPGNSDLENYLINNGITVKRISYNGKKNIPKAIIKTYLFLKRNKTNIVHTHLFDACIVGLTAAYIARTSKRIYTRHHSDFHHTYHPRAVRWDKISNFLATDVIAISEVVKQVLLNKENVAAKKIHLVHHGFKTDAFSNIPPASVAAMKEKYNKEGKHPVIGVISRYLELKGIQYIIPAFKKLLIDYPDALLILANSNGNYKNEIEKLLKEIPAGNYIEIPFENDIFVLYQLFDVFVHVPIDFKCEAFGQTYVEALAAKTPSVFTLSGVASEFIVNRENALVVPYKDSDAIVTAVKLLIDNDKLASEITVNGEKEIRNRFGIDKMILSLEQLYAK